MKYRVERIGAEFSKKAIENLGKIFSGRYQEGYRFHSVFQVTQPGCLGIGQGTITYLAVYEKIDE